MSERGEIRAEELVWQGLAASRGGDSLKAVQLFREADDAQPDSAVPHFLLGAELAQSGDIAGAEAAYANAVLLAPGFDMARFQLGLLQFTAGRVSVALVTWSPLLQRPADQSLQRFAAGFEALARDDFQAAMNCFGEGLQLERSNEPLKADIRMVMARIEPLLVTKAPAAASTDGPVLEENDVHVLLSNYQRQGSVH